MFVLGLEVYRNSMIIMSLTLHCRQRDHPETNRDKFLQMYNFKNSMLRSEPREEEEKDDEKEDEKEDEEEKRHAASPTNVGT